MDYIQSDINPKCCLASVLPMGSSTFMLATQDPDEESAIQQETPIFEKRDTVLHGPGRKG